MIKFTLRGTDNDRTVTHEFAAISIPEILPQFEDFLKGLGFNLNGTIEVIAPEDSSNLEFDFDETDLAFSKHGGTPNV